MKKSLLFLLLTLLHAYYAYAGQSEYEAALAAITEGTYYIVTDVNGTKYYVTNDGLLTSVKDEAGAFIITKTSGGYFGTGFRIDTGTNRFTNPPLSNNVANLKPGSFAHSTGDRTDWERQILYLNDDGKYAIRSCNCADGTSSWYDAARTHWTYYMVDDVVTPCYTYDLAYVWELEASLDIVQTTINGVHYNIDYKKEVAQVICLFDNAKYNGDIVIQNSIEYADKVFPVTSIGASAFRNCTDLTSITIPNSVTNIGSCAFYNCRNLTDVYCYAENVPSTESDAFDESKVEYSRLHVPAAPIASYKATAPWSGFGAIVGIGEDADTETVEIATAEDLKNFADRVNDGETILCAKLTADIDFTAYPTSVIRVGYYGEFDGAGHSIRLDINRTSDCALFGFLCGYVHDLTTTGTITTPVMFAGGIAAQTGKATIERCQSRVDINSSVDGDGTHGGIVGVSNDGSIIRDCIFSGSITGNNTRCCGGISGWANGMTYISNCLVKGDITVSTTRSDLLSRNSSNVISSNNYFQGEWNAPNNCSNVTLLTESQVESGEACYRLNAGRTGEEMAWYQTLGEDDFPVPDNSHLLVLYSNGLYRNEITTITIGSSGFATYCSSYPLDFSEVSGMKAYIASGFSPSTGKLVLTRVTEVPAGEGLYLVGEAGTYEVAIAETDMFYSNLLKGVTSATTINPTDGSYTNFILANGAHGVAFYSLSEAGQLAAGKAYLQLPTAIVPEVKAINGIFDDDNEDGISRPTPAPSRNGGEVYNLQGQQVSAPKSGLYIINGKKMFIK